MTDFLSSILFFFLLFLRRSQAALDATTMNEHLTTGARLLGTYTPPTSRNLSNWMSAYNDSTPIQSLNIPGTHDSLTCQLSSSFFLVATSTLTTISVLFSQGIPLLISLLLSKLRTSAFSIS